MNIVFKRSMRSSHTMFFEKTPLKFSWDFLRYEKSNSIKKSNRRTKLFETFVQVFQDNENQLLIKSYWCSRSSLTNLIPHLKWAYVDILTNWLLQDSDNDFTLYMTVWRTIMLFFSSFLTYLLNCMLDIYIIFG